MHNAILKLDVAGMPVDWITWQTAATLYTRDAVRWEAGSAFFDIVGGYRDDGQRSRLRICSIVAVQERSRKRPGAWTPPLTNPALFARDGYVCCYCGQLTPARLCTRDHVVPKSRGGPDTWANTATACRGCNGRKRDRTPDEAGMPLLAVPYVPDPAAYLMLMASRRRVLADQQAWLETFAKAAPH